MIKVKGFIEILIDFNQFINIDLCKKGVYQIRITIDSVNKLQ